MKREIKVNYSHEEAASMNTYTDTQLKKALAKMLPEKIKHTSILVWITPENYCCQVRETELLHLCWLVEKFLSQDDCAEYSWQLQYGSKLEIGNITHYSCHRSWQQRTIALAKILNIEIV